MGVLAFAFTIIVIRRGRSVRAGTQAVRAGAATTTTSGTANANGTAANPPRRSRRPRRTPSQISTKSLPAYMEQPGDEELVLVQCVAFKLVFNVSAPQIH